MFPLIPLVLGAAAIITAITTPACSSTPRKEDEDSSGDGTAPDVPAEAATGDYETISEETYDGNSEDVKSQPDVDAYSPPDVVDSYTPPDADTGDQKDLAEQCVLDQDDVTDSVTEIAGDIVEMSEGIKDFAENIADKIDAGIDNYVKDIFESDGQTPDQQQPDVQITDVQADESPDLPDIPDLPDPGAELAELTDNFVLPDLPHIDIGGDEAGETDSADAELAAVEINDAPGDTPPDTPSDVPPDTPAEIVEPDAQPDLPPDIPPPPDADGDGVADEIDNCQFVSNPGQLDNDKDGIGNACDTETCDGIDNDGDGVADEGFSIGAACFVGKGICYSEGAIACDGPAKSKCNAVAGKPLEEICNALDDNCNGATDEIGGNVTDLDKDGICDELDNDNDNDGVLDEADNCWLVKNPDQLDKDEDGVGNACDCTINSKSADFDKFIVLKAYGDPEHLMPLPLALFKNLLTNPNLPNQQIYLSASYYLNNEPIDPKDAQGMKLCYDANWPLVEESACKKGQPAPVACAEKFVHLMARTPWSDLWDLYGTLNGASNVNLASLVANQPNNFGLQIWVDPPEETSICNHLFSTNACDN